MDTGELIVVLTSTAEKAEAESLARGMIEAKLAACVQILPPMTSLFPWDGDVQSEPEHLMLIKTTASRYDELEQFILANHRYDVPEVVAIPAAKVSAGYLDWVIKSTA